jgi:hypothetical protein
MAEPKPFASLSSTLLARKGGAKPAMRPQLAPLDSRGEALSHDPHEDLGWNDMGNDEQVFTAEIASVTPEQPMPAAVVPEVVRQQQALPRRVANGPAATSKRRSALADGRRAAFTLRVDAERHLRLRLACTVSNRSAQQMVTEALDRLLEELPDITALAAQVAARR